MDLPLFFTLPLIGGFAFVSSFFLLRWRSARQDAQRLYYRAAVWGGVLILAATLVHATLMIWPVYQRGFDGLFADFLQPLLTGKEALPPRTQIVRAHVALVCVYSLLLGVGLPPLAGSVLKWTTGAKSSFLVKLNLAAITDPLEKLLSRSLLEGEAVQVTLSTGKVYVGYVLEALDPDLPTKFIKLQPVMSGQRGTDGQVEYTTFYDEILAEFRSSPASRSRLDLFQQVVPIDKVVTVSGFDFDAYGRFLFERQRGETASTIDQKAGPAVGPNVVPWLLLAGAALVRILL